MTTTIKEIEKENNRIHRSRIKKSEELALEMLDCIKADIALRFLNSPRAKNEKIKKFFNTADIFEIIDKLKNFKNLTELEKQQFYFTFC